MDTYRQSSECFRYKLGGMLLRVEALSLQQGNILTKDDGYATGNLARILSIMMLQYVYDLTGLMLVI